MLHFGNSCSFVFMVKFAMKIDKHMMKNRYFIVLFKVKCRKTCRLQGFELYDMVHNKEF